MTTWLKQKVEVTVLDWIRLCDLIVSLISTLLIIILFISELKSFLFVNREDKITIDHTRSEKLQINFNISLYEIPCDGNNSVTPINH